MEEAFSAILQSLNLPTWVVLLIVVAAGVATLFAGRFPVWVRPLITALRVGAMAALRPGKKLAQAVQRQRVEIPKPPPAPEPPPAEDPGRLVPCRAPEEIQAEKERFGDAGG